MHIVSTCLCLSVATSRQGRSWALDYDSAVKDSPLLRNSHLLHARKDSPLLLARLAEKENTSPHNALRQVDKGEPMIPAGGVRPPCDMWVVVMLYYLHNMVLAWLTVSTFPMCPCITFCTEQEPDYCTSKIPVHRHDALKKRWAYKHLALEGDCTIGYSIARITYEVEHREGSCVTCRLPDKSKLFRVSV